MTLDGLCRTCRGVIMVPSFQSYAPPKADRARYGKAALAVGVPVFLILVGLLLIDHCAPLPAAKTPSATPPTSTAKANAAPIALAAVFAPWYGYDPATANCRGGIGSYHWNNDPNMAGGVDTPERGYYCSADPDVIKWQLVGLERAGVQTVFLSWWGWGDGDLDGNIEGHPDAYLNRGIRALLDQIAALTGTQKIRVSLIVEPFVKTQAGIEPGTLQPAQRAHVLDWLWTDYYGNPKYRDLWFEWEGKPLLIAFDPMTLTLPISPTYPISYTIRNWTGRPKGDDTAGRRLGWFFSPPQQPAAV